MAEGPAISRRSIIAAAVAAVGVAAVTLGRNLARNERLSTALPSGARRFLETAPQFVVYSLHPRPMEIDPSELAKKPTFHGYLILGQAAVTLVEDRTALLHALYDGMSGVANPANCFNPRHGVRASGGGRTVDLVLCFECQQFDVYDGSSTDHKYITSSPAGTFKVFLSRAHVPLPPK